MITICTPSRGLIHSRTVESLINGGVALIKAGHNISYSMTHNLSIPNSHNACVLDALSVKSELVIFIEEDMGVDPETYVALVESDADITTVQYNDKNGDDQIVHYNTDQTEILWCGLGATAIKTAVFEKVGVPYFSTERRYKIVRGELEKIENPGSPWSYGGLDVDFFTRARKLGFKIKVLEGHKAKHYRVDKLGEEHTNNGVHDITEV